MVIGLFTQKYEQKSVRNKVSLKKGWFLVIGLFTQKYELMGTRKKLWP